MDDTINDEIYTVNQVKDWRESGITSPTHDCQDCSNARLIDRQRKEIERLTSELEVERGRNCVLGFQIRTLREGK